ncbi:Kelch repeat-containing protein [Chloroflexota bacterium]
MKNSKTLLVTVLIFCAIGVITFSMFVLSSATAAREASIDKNMASSDNATDRWQILADMVRGRGDPGVVVVNDKIHAISGFWSPGYGYVFNQEVYDPISATWQSLSMVPEPRSDFVALNYAGNIYTIGGWREPDPDSGYDDVGVLGFNHMYDPAVDEWFPKQPLLVPLSGAAGVVLNDKLYIIGGFTRNLQTTNKVQIYDPLNNTWDYGTPMNSARSGFGAVVLDGLIYAIGGQDPDNINDVEIYDPATDLWSAGPALPERRASMAVTVLGGKIYVIGGVENETSAVKDTMFVFDPDTNLWSTGKPMPTARSNCRAVAISDKIYVIGGVGEMGAGRANEGYGPFPPPVHIPIVKK